jgi:hypothetical protein
MIAVKSKKKLNERFAPLVESGQELRLYQKATRIGRVVSTGMPGYTAMQNMMRDIMGLLEKANQMRDKDDYATFLFQKKPEILEIVQEPAAKYMLKVVKESVMIHKGNVEFGFEKLFGTDATVVIPESFWNESAQEILEATHRLKSGVEKIIDATADPEKAEAVKAGWRDMTGKRMRDEAWKAQSATAQRVHAYSGIRSYVWQTKKDERVVGNPVGFYPHGTAEHGDHWSRDGKIFRWDAPPHDGHPGSAFGCRCEAVPMISLKNPELV